MVNDTHESHLFTFMSIVLSIFNITKNLFKGIILLKF